MISCCYLTPNLKSNRFLGCLYYYEDGNSMLLCWSCQSERSVVIEFHKSSQKNLAASPTCHLFLVDPIGIKLYNSWHWLDKVRDGKNWVVVPGAYSVCKGFLVQVLWWVDSAIVKNAAGELYTDFIKRYNMQSSCFSETEWIKTEATPGQIFWDYNGFGILVVGQEIWLVF